MDSTRRLLGVLPSLFSNFSIGSACGHPEALVSMASCRCEQRNKPCERKRASAGHQTLPNFFRTSITPISTSPSNEVAGPSLQRNDKPIPHACRSRSHIRVNGDLALGHEYDLQERFEGPREAVRRFRDTVDAKRQSLTLSELTTPEGNITDSGNRFFRLLEGQETIA